MLLSIERYAKQITVTGLAVLLLGNVVAILVPAGLGWDFSNFYDTGSRILAKQAYNLYDHRELIDGNPPLGSMAFWGTPLSAYFFAPMALLAPQSALIVFKIQNALMLALAAWWVFVFYGRRRDPSLLPTQTYGAIFVVILLLFQPLWTGYRVGGQTTATVLALLVGSMMLHVRGDAFAAALLFALAVVIKPFLAPGFALLALASGPRFFAWATICGLGFAGASVGLLGWPLHEEFLARVREGGMFVAIWGSGLILPVDSLTLLLQDSVPALTLDGWRTLVVTGIKMLALGVTIRLLWAGRNIEQPAARRHLDFQCAIVFALFVSSAVWEHYLALLLPLLTFWVIRFAITGTPPARLVTALLFLMPAQNLIVLLALRAVTAVPSPADLAGSIVRAAPLWIVLWIMWKYRDQVASAFEDAERLARRGAAPPVVAREVA